MTRRFFPFVTLMSLVLSMAAFSTPALADIQTCTLKGGLTGICETTCGADSVDASSLGAINSNEYDPSSNGGCQGTTCCIPKGQDLCMSLGTSAPAAPVNLLGAWTCAANCLDQRMTQYAGFESCSGATICCSNGGTRTGTTTVQTVGQTATLGSPTTLVDPLGGANIYTLIQRVISTFLGVVGALALAVFVYAGFMWMTAGSSDRVKTAKAAMMNAVIGLALIAFAYVITNFFINALTGGVTSQAATTQQQSVATPPTLTP